RAGTGRRWRQRPGRARTAARRRRPLQAPRPHPRRRAARRAGRLNAYRVYLLYGAAMATFRQVIDPIVAVYYVRVVGLQPLDLVLLGTVVLVAGLLFEIPTGVVADTYSRKVSVVIGVALSGVCFVAQGLLPILAVI